MGAQAAAPVKYRSTLIADTSSLFVGLSSTVPLNSSGSVAFFAYLRGGGVGIFTGNGGSITTIADTNNPLLTFGFSGIAFNNMGTVAFPLGVKGGGVGVFVGSGGPITTIADSSKGIVSIGEPVSINNSGTVAFFGSEASGIGGLFAGNGGPITTLYDNSPGSPFSTFGSPAINDHGIVAFAAVIKNNTGGLAGIFTGMGAPTFTKIMDETGNILLRTSRPDFNNAGTVAFDGEFKDTGDGGIFIGNGGPVITIADTSGPFSGFPGSTPIINNNGEVIFLATLDAGGIGIFSGPDSAADKIIETGDPLLGSVVTDLPSNGSRLGLNDAGQVTFLASLADGREVIVRADPPTFAGTPGKANCHGQSVSALAKQFGGLNNAAAELGYPSVDALQNAIMEFCGG
jgi:hypothetical protein